MTFIVNVRFYFKKKKKTKRKFLPGAGKLFRAIRNRRCPSQYATPTVTWFPTGVNVYGTFPW